MVGPSARMKGGITTVINGYKKSVSFNTKYYVKYFSSCVDGSLIKKAIFSSLKIFIFPFVCLFFRPKIIHIHSAFGTSFYRKSIYVKIACFFKISVINHIHGAEWDRFYSNKSEKGKANIVRIYNKCQYLIVLSDEWKHLFASVGVTKPIIVIPNFVSINKNDLLFEKHFCANKRVVFLGEICERKGAFNLPLIAQKIILTGFKNFAFIVAGYGETQKLANLIKEKNVSSNIDIIGFVDYEQKVKLLQNADVFLFPSYNEGVPMVLLEAMAFGIPCVTTDIGGIPSIINKNYNNGKLFSPNDFDGMTNEILKLFVDDAYYKTLSKHCKKVAEIYSLDNNVNKISLLYNNLLKKGK